LEMSLESANIFTFVRGKILQLPSHR
jgi:hypothetical protein